MICLYEKTETNFTYNGLGTLEPTECSFFPSINGVWTLKMTLPIDPEGKSNLIANDRILKVTDIDCIEEQTSDYQLFRIYDFRKEQNYVYVNALPIGLDARFDTFVRSLKLYNKTAAGALSDINNLSNKYTVSGSGYDSTVKSAEFENANIISILNGEESFVTTWDGEICYDNYNLKVNHRLGTNSTPLDVRYGKNIMGMSYDLDASNVVTRLYPKAKSGELLNAIADYKIANEQYVDAENASDYPIPHIYYCEAPYNLVQLSDDGSEEYTASHELYEGIKWLTAAWLRESLTNDSVYDGLLNEIELDWIINNYALTFINDNVIGLVEHIARNIWTNDYHNILSGTVQTLIYNAIKAGWEEVLKNTESEFYLGNATKSWRNNFYSYTWDVNGDFRLRAEADDIAWVYASSKWHQVDESGYATGVTDSAKWKWYKKKVNGVTIKRYGNKKKNRYLHSQWWKINDVWYWFNANGEGKKGAWLNNTYNEYFDEAEIDYSGSDHTIYEMLLPVCIAGEEDLFTLLYRQMTIYCAYLFETDKLSFPTIKLEIDMVDLSRTEEYKDYSYLERIHLGNEVRVYNPRLMPEPSTVRVIGLTYDVLRKCNTEITIGITESSVINLLNSIGQSKETKYVAGDGITIENNVINVTPPSTPYLTDCIVNGESKVRNHIAYIDLDEMGIDETIDVLYGEDVPDDEDDGEDKDFYFSMDAEVLKEDECVLNSSTGHPMTLTGFTNNGGTYGFTITGNPYVYGEGEEAYFPLDSLIVGEAYTITFTIAFGAGTQFVEAARNKVDVCNTEIILTDTADATTYTKTFTYTEGGILDFGFYRLKDNRDFTCIVSNLTITGDAFGGSLIDLYNKYNGIWLKYKTPPMIGATSLADGESGSVPKPLIAERDKFLRGDGTWAHDELSKLTDVELINLSDGDIPKWDSTEEKWKNGHDELSKLADFEITDIQDGDVPMWDSTEEKWKNGRGGGSESLPLSVVDGKLCITYENS